MQYLFGAVGREAEDGSAGIAPAAVRAAKSGRAVENASAPVGHAGAGRVSVGKCAEAVQYAVPRRGGLTVTNDAGARSVLKAREFRRLRARSERDADGDEQPRAQTGGFHRPILSATTVPTAPP